MKENLKQKIDTRNVVLQVTVNPNIDTTEISSTETNITST